jgi:hypothetical protein
MQTPFGASLLAATRSIVRSKVCDTLAKHATEGNHGPFRAVVLFQEICEELVQAGVIASSPAGSPFTQLKADQLSHLPDLGAPAEIARFVRQALWELYLQEILAPAPESEFPLGIDRGGRPYSYLDLDYGILTEYGRDILTDATSRIQVHDPDGYLDNFRNAAPPADVEMMRYLEESVAVFRGAHFLGTVVLLGIASERLIDVLAERLRDALDVPGRTEWFNGKYFNKRDISARFRALSGKLVGEYSEDLDRAKLKDAWTGVVTLTFEQIRCARNDIAHPMGREFTWNEVSGFLHSFVQYFLYINRIVSLLESKPGST